MELSEGVKMILRGHSVFTPAAPIRKRDLFAGRVEQIASVVDAVVVPGRHVIMYGERGVGKTSLANIIDELLPERFIEEHEGFFRWVLIFGIGGLVVRFILEGLGLWPWQ